MPDCPIPPFLPDYAGRDAQRLSPLVLAFVGDAVYNLYVRALITNRRDMTPHSLHALCSKIVCAKAQARSAEFLQEGFSEREREIFRRGKNAKPGTVPKNADPGDYAKATGLEAVIGYLYINNENERMAELLARALDMSLEAL